MQQKTFIYLSSLVFENVGFGSDHHHFTEGDNKTLGDDK
jgi:hypothetical protein